jgi:hypothetical protein
MVWLGHVPVMVMLEPCTKLGVLVPVPPLATAKVPAKVIVPAAVMGPPDVVKPVVPPETATLVTVPEPLAEMYSTSVAPELTAKTLPALPL